MERPKGRRCKWLRKLFGGSDSKYKPHNNDGVTTLEEGKDPWAPDHLPQLSSAGDAPAQLISLTTGGANQTITHSILTAGGNINIINHAGPVTSSWLEQSPGRMLTSLLEIPAVPRIFFGREEIVEDLASKLSSESSDGSISSRLCILGIGGIGKTVTASAIINHEKMRMRFKDCCYWVPCVAANSATTFLFALYRALGLRGKTEGLASVIQALSKTREPQILVLDNFETTWHPVDGIQQIRQIIYALDNLAHVSILVTMRSELPPLDHWSHIHLPALAPEDSQRIYTAIDSEALAPSHQKDLASLLQMIGHLPYAITLMANRGKASYASPSDLLQEWKDLGTSMFKATTPEDGIEYSIEKSVNSRLIMDSPGALHLLQVLSMLPVGVNTSELSVWAGRQRSQALDALRNAALVQTAALLAEDGGSRSRNYHIIVLPVLQSYMHQDQRIPDSVRDQVYEACFALLLQHKEAVESPDNEGFKEAYALISSQEPNIHALILPLIHQALGEGHSTERDKPIPMTRYPSMLGSLLGYVRYLRWSRPQPETMKHILQLAQQQKDMYCEAEIRVCLCASGKSTSNSRECYESLSKASELFMSLREYRRAARAKFSSLFFLFMGSHESGDGTLPSSLQALERARTEWEAHEAFQQDEQIKAAILLYSGLIKQFVQDMYPEYLDELKEAHGIYTNTGRTYFATVCIQAMATAEGLGGHFSESLEKYEEVLRTCQELAYGESGMAETMASAYLMKGTMLQNLHRWGDPQLLESLEASLRIYKDILNDQPHVAMVINAIEQARAGERMRLRTNMT